MAILDLFQTLPDDISLIFSLQLTYNTNYIGIFTKQALFSERLCDIVIDYLCCKVEAITWVCVCCHHKYLHN